MPKESPISHTRLYRSETNKIIAGVCGGLGEYFNIDPTIIRILFILFTLLHGAGLLIYIIMWVLIPTENQATTNSNDHIKENVEEMKQRAKSFAHDLRMSKNPTNRDDSRLWWSILIIAVGFFFLFRNFGLFDELNLGQFWPVILIVLGLVFILRR